MKRILAKKCGGKKGGKKGGCKRAIMACLCAALLSACSTTTITETEYADDGSTVVKQTVREQSGNPFVILAANSANKSWALRQGGWRFNVGYDPSTNSVGINGGSIDNMLASVTDSQFGVETAKVVPDIYAQSKYTLSVSKDGISSEGSTDTKTE